MDTSDVVSIFLRGALGRRGRKRARRAVNFLTGHRGFLTASTLLGAAGVAWGVYDSLKAAPGASGALGSAGAVPLPGAAGAVPAATGAYASGGGAITGPVMPPPLPTSIASEAVLPNDVLRIVRLAVSAARADGTLSPQERALIIEHARAAGIESTVEQELNTPQPLADIVRGISDSQRRQDLYVLAFSIVRADENVSGAERIYLAQLAYQLGLDAETTARLEQDTASAIDKAPESEP
ncbi:MAG TPA: DUF533 domain-containing protein [Vicinamibacterales bacterium]|nr:DUF533 domain-containing protein [Vicinamibacterales bacterium]